MFYIYLHENAVQECIPEFNEVFPGIPIEKRYSQDLLKKCVQWNEEVPQGWLYDKETNTFNAPPEPPEPEYAEPEPFEPIPVEELPNIAELLKKIEEKTSDLQTAFNIIAEGVLGGD